MSKKITSDQLRLIKKHLMKEYDEEMRQNIAAKKQAPFRLHRKGGGSPVQEDEEVEVDVEEKKKVEKEPVKAEKTTAIPGYDAIKTKLNIIRSGKSLDNAEISSQLQAYFNDLSEAEKVAVFAYFDAIGGIVAGGEVAAKEDKPSEGPYKVQMALDRPGTEPVAAPSKKRKERVAVAKDAPIVVGESARNKEQFKKLIRRNR